MKKTNLLVAVFLCIFLYIINIYHIGTFPKSELNISSQLVPPPENKIWFPKKDYGINHIFLKGTPYQRGFLYGKKTKHLLYKQENELQEQLSKFFSSISKNLLFLSAMKVFSGIEKFYPQNMVEEMYGVSKHASNEFNFLGEPLTRQIAYHILHEVGQSFIDFGQGDFGCTVFALKDSQEKKWLIGRNFDFEGGNTFDLEKIVKWSFPPNKNAYVSITWAGMVGSVTAINENGLYISLNAAGSEDFALRGTPTTLIVTKAIEDSKTIQDAIKIITEAKTFITDIFILADKKTNSVYKIEKSPKKYIVKKLKNSAVITNHLQDKIWENDSVNEYRKKHLTTVTRFKRGLKLIKQKDDFNIDDHKTILSYLRDKGENGLSLGNRAAIDSLIATHSVIFNPSKMTIYVSTGPSLVGKFLGYDLNQSFKFQKPILKDELPEDKKIDLSTYTAIKNDLKTASKLKKLTKGNKCKEARKHFDNIFHSNTYLPSIFYSLGLFSKNCDNHPEKSKVFFKKAMDANPAYLDFKKSIAKELESK